MTKEKKLKLSDVLGETVSKKERGDRRFVFGFKVKEFSVKSDVRIKRLDAKKLLPFEEYKVHSKTGKRVVAKKKGYKNGELWYYEGMKNPKGKWIADENKPLTQDKYEVETVVYDKDKDKVMPKDTKKGLWFNKVIPIDLKEEWQIEDSYALWFDSEELVEGKKIWQYLMDNKLVGVYKFNPSGTVYNAFLIPHKQKDSDGRIELGFILETTRRKLKLSSTYTFTLLDVESIERERAREKQEVKVSGVEEI